LKSVKTGPGAIRVMNTMPAVSACAYQRPGHKSYLIVTQALSRFCEPDHRECNGADPLLGDGAGILLQILIR
jgi:glutamate synthase domain-containing protein 1